MITSTFLFNETKFKATARQIPTGINVWIEDAVLTKKLPGHYVTFKIEEGMLIAPESSSQSLRYLYTAIGKMLLVDFSTVLKLKETAPLN